jgi:hypothetical protein
MRMRFNPDTGIYIHCKWCKGNGIKGHGCLQCSSEADKDYKSAFPNGPEPIATLSIEELQTLDLKDVFGPEAIMKAFGEGGGGSDEIVANLKKAREQSQQA